MENLTTDLHNLVERNSYILYSLLEYLSVKGIVAEKAFVDFCSTMESKNYKKEIFRNEEDTRSVKDNLHPGGIKATVELCDMAGITSGRHVLDAGTGHGGAARIIAENYGCRVTGIDTDYIRLVNAIFRTRILELDHLVSFSLENAYDMSFDNNSFDAVIRQHSVYGGEEEAFVDECRRVLKPNGVIAFHGILKRISLGGKKRKMEDYSLDEYFELLKAKGFRLKAAETENSTKELMESLENSNSSMYEMLKKKLITGIKLVAVVEEETL